MFCSKALQFHISLVNGGAPQAKTMLWRRTFSAAADTAAHAELRQSLRRTKDALAGLMASGVPVETIEANSLMKQLIKTGSLADARSLFDAMPCRDEISWTTIVAGYVDASLPSEALRLFSAAQAAADVRMDPFLISLVLKACGLAREFGLGGAVHGYSVKFGLKDSVFVGSAVLDLYMKAGSVAMALCLFHEMRVKNVVSWTALITGLVRAGCNREAIGWFSDMWVSGVECDSYTFASVLKACADSGALGHGRAVHTQALKMGLSDSSFVANTLAFMYNKCGRLDYGLRLFERMRAPDVVSWTTSISSYVQMGCGEHAINAFVQMRGSGAVPNEYTYAAVLSASTGMMKIELGMQLHGLVFMVGFVGCLSVDNAIMTMYSRCGHLFSATVVFWDMKTRDVVSWSAIISGYCQEGQEEEAFELFLLMRREGTKPNEFSIASLISVCAYMASLEQGKQVHSFTLRIGVDQDPMVNSALINMYSKCGGIDEAKEIFDTGSDDLVSWTAMINGFAEHGFSKEAIELFEKMASRGLRPDYVTYIGVLSACTHAGLVELGYHYFRSMKKDYQMNPGREHYGCMVDLLARSGRLSEAESIVEEMPFAPDDVVWSTLLMACRTHGDAECGRRVAQRILELTPSCAGTHITLSNILSATGMWRDAADVRKMMRAKGVKKEPGWSWIESVNKVSAFVASDRSHPEDDEIYETLSLLAADSKMAGTPSNLSLLPDC